LYKGAGQTTMKIDRGARHNPFRISWTFSIFLAVTAVHAQPAEKCDTLVPAQGQIEYRWRQNRCEGFYRSNVSSGDLELVSLLVGRLPGETTRDSQLEIVVPAVPRPLSGPVRIRAVAIPPRHLLVMEFPSVPVVASRGWQPTGVQVAKGDAIRIAYVSGSWRPDRGVELGNPFELPPPRPRGGPPGTRLRHRPSASSVWRVGGQDRR
jgi:hypothetical protein